MLVVALEEEAVQSERAAELGPIGIFLNNPMALLLRAASPKPADSRRGN